MMRSGGRLLIECLLAVGATKSFGVLGDSYLAVLDALTPSQTLAQMRAAALASRKVTA